MSYEDLLPDIIIGASSAFTGWIVARRKNKIEADSNEIDNLDKAVAMWRTIAEDLKKENEEKRKQEKGMRDEILDLRNRISDLEERLINQK